MVIFLDIETTGVEKTDKICSLGMVVFEEELFIESAYNIVNEGKKIPSKASSLHNITNEMIENAPLLRESEIFIFLQKHCNEATLVVHNASFVLGTLQRAGCVWRGEVIDTRKVTQHLIPECELFTLEFLRYELKLYRDEWKIKELCGVRDVLVAHHALSDAIVIKLLFDYLRENYVDREKMSILTFENLLFEKFTFGKYSGRYIEEIAMQDRNYLLWLLSLEDIDSDVRYSVEYYLKGAL